MLVNVSELLYINAEKYPDKIAIADRKRKLTYSKLLNEVDTTARYLLKKGIKKNDRVLIFVPMSISLYSYMLAIFSIGAIAIFIDAWAGKERLEIACRIANCKAFIGSPKAHILRLFSKEIRKIPIKIISGFVKFDLSTSKEFTPVRTDIDDTALITFSTGSTAIPKAAKRTHRFLLAQHKILKEHLNPNIDDIDMPLLPIFVLNNLGIGSTSVIPDFNPAQPERIDLKKLIQTIHRDKINTTSGSPIIYENLAKYCLKNGMKLKYLKKIFLGGAPVFPTTAKLLKDAFEKIEIEIIYGSTEAEPISSIRVEELLSNTSLSNGLLVGKPIEEIDIRIIKNSDQAITISSLDEFRNISQPVNEPGEICVSGDHVLKHYYNNPQAEIDNKIKVGNKIWHRTGDAGYIDDSGSLFLLGRLKNRLIINDQVKYLFPVEQQLLEIDNVNIGTILKSNDNIFIIVETCDSANESEIRESVDKLNIGCDKIIFIDKIPRDPRHNTKIDYTLLSKIIEE